MNDKSRGKPCKSFKAYVRVGKARESVFYVRFLVNAFVAMKMKGFCWPSFTKAYMEVCEEDCDEWGAELEKLWKECEPLMEDIGPELERTKELQSTQEHDQHPDSPASSAAIEEQPDNEDIADESDAECEYFCALENTSLFLILLILLLCGSHFVFA